MTAKNVYETCPVYETETFLLRLVKREDAVELLSCYSDKKAVEKCNADCCTSDFYYTALEQMEECIDTWLKAYEVKAYVRFAVIPKAVGKPRGTVEVFGGNIGVLRMDLAAAYDEACCIEELLNLAIRRLIRDFGIKSLKIKAGNTPERVPLLEKYGFVPSKSFRPQSSYYERPDKRRFNSEKGMAYCGLACCVCSENTSCPGCKISVDEFNGAERGGERNAAGKTDCSDRDTRQNTGCSDRDTRQNTGCSDRNTCQNTGCSDRNTCQNYRCCQEKGLGNCGQCSAYPCESPMLQKPRVRAFFNFSTKYGEQMLLLALKNNEENGVIYHYEDKLTGDYDLARNEEEIDQMLCMGAGIEMPFPKEEDNECCGK